MAARELYFQRQPQPRSSAMVLTAVLVNPESHERVDLSPQEAHRVRSMARRAPQAHGFAEEQGELRVALDDTPSARIFDRATVAEISLPASTAQEIASFVTDAEDRARREHRIRSLIVS